MEPADNPGDWSDMLLPGSELDAIPADGVDSRVAFRDGPTRPARGLVRFLYSSNPGLRPGPMAKPLVRLFEAYRSPAWRARRASGLKR